MATLINMDLKQKNTWKKSQKKGMIPPVQYSEEGKV